MSMATVLTSHANQDLLTLQRLGRATKFVILLLQARYLLQNIKINKGKSLSAQTNYLFVIKYLIIRFELIQLNVTAVAFNNLFALSIFIPLQVRIDEQHPGDCNKCDHYTL